MSWSPGTRQRRCRSAIGDDDRCDGCEILDDGSIPSRGHVLFHRTFEMGGRSFDMYVELGSEPRASDLARVNDVLAALVIDPAPGVEPPPPLVVPSGWFQDPDPLPALVDPVIVVSAGSWRFPSDPLIACGVQPALEALPPDGAFLWILRYPIGPGEFLGAFRNADPWPDHFTLDLPSRPSDAECADGTDGSMRQYAFSGPEGLYYQVQVALGTEATHARAREVETVLSSFRP